MGEGRREGGRKAREQIKIYSLIKIIKIKLKSRHVVPRHPGQK